MVTTVVFAQVYAARANMRPLVVARDGGQLESTSMVDNYPGFKDGVDAVDLILALKGQVIHRLGWDPAYDS